MPQVGPLLLGLVNPAVPLREPQVVKSPPAVPRHANQAVTSQRGCTGQPQHGRAVDPALRRRARVRCAGSLAGQAPRAQRFLD